jgi:hypothetical protein
MHTHCFLTRTQHKTLTTQNFVLQGETLGDAWLNFLMAESSDTSALNDATKPAAAAAAASRSNSSSSASGEQAPGKALLLAQQGSSSTHTVSGTPPTTS